MPPNELLHWTGIEWARDRGYRYYDFDDISLPVARAVLAGGDVPAGSSTLTGFKLRFGGEVVVFPGAHDRCRPAALGPALRLVASPAGRLRPLAERALRRGRA